MTVPSYPSKIEKRLTEQHAQRQPRDSAFVPNLRLRRDSQSSMHRGSHVTVPSYPSKIEKRLTEQHAQRHCHVTVPSYPSKIEKRLTEQHAQRQPRDSAFVPL